MLCDFDLTPEKLDEIEALDAILRNVSHMVGEPHTGERPVETALRRIVYAWEPSGLSGHLDAMRMLHEEKGVEPADFAIDMLFAAPAEA